MTLVSLAGLALLGLALWFSVTRPVLAISRALKSDARDLPDWLSRSRTEFGELARLVADSGRQRDELRKSEEKYRLVVQNAGEAILVAQDGRLAFTNPRVSDIVGHAQDALLGKPFLDFIHPADRDLVAARYRQRLAGEAVPPWYEFRIIRRDGEVRVVGINAVRIDWMDRPATLNFLADVTERRRAEAELAKRNAELTALNEEKNRFLGMAAHDLRNPLSVVSAASSFLLDDAGRRLPEEKQLEFLARIRRNSDFMLRLIDELLDVAKIESGRLELNLTEGDVGPLIEENIAMNRILAEDKGIGLDYCRPGPLPRVRFDRQKLEQVLNNLVSNAVKFSHPGSSVTVCAKQEDDEVVVTVADRGQGIPQAELAGLFHPFRKTSVRSTAGEKSTGLGLAICRRIIEGHDGRIWVQSEPGKGSAFSFSLPVTAERQ